MAAATLLDCSVPIQKPPRHLRLEALKTSQWAKRPKPKPTENGNWVCEDQECKNVNYPRRFQCHKCGKKRGPNGDAVVRAYLHSLRSHHGMPMPMPMPMLVPTHPPLLSRGMQCERAPHGIMRCIPPTHMRAPLIPPLHLEDPNRYPYELLNSHNTFEKVQTQSTSPYVPPLPNPMGSSILNNGERLSTEGKRLAEQLISLFSKSSDPFSETQHCLAEATSWLHSMKFKLQAQQLPQYGSGTIAPKISTNLHENKSYYTLSKNNFTVSPPLGASEKTGHTSFNTLPFQLPNLTWENLNYQHRDYMQVFDKLPLMKVSSKDSNSNLWGCENCKVDSLSKMSLCFECSKMDPDGEDMVTKYVGNLLKDLD